MLMDYVLVKLLSTRKSTRHLPTKDLIRLPELILTLNNFQFNDSFYNQIIGTAMGTPLAPKVRQPVHGQSRIETSLVCFSQIIDLATIH